MQVTYAGHPVRPVILLLFLVWVIGSAAVSAKLPDGWTPAFIVVSILLLFRMPFVRCADCGESGNLAWADSNECEAMRQRRELAGRPKGLRAFVPVVLLVVSVLLAVLVVVLAFFHHAPHR